MTEVNSIAFVLFRVFRVFRGSFLCRKKTIHEIHEIHEKPKRRVTTSAPSGTTLPSSENYLARLGPAGKR